MSLIVVDGVLQPRHILAIRKALFIIIRQLDTNISTCFSFLPLGRYGEAEALHQQEFALFILSLPKHNAYVCSDGAYRWSQPLY